MKKLLLVLPVAMLFCAGAVLAQEEHPGMWGMGGKWVEAHKKMHQEMVDYWNKQDAKLDQLLSTAKSAKGDNKVTALEAVVAEMVAQRKAMHERMSNMHQRMMELWTEKGAPATTGTSPAPTATPE